MIFIEHNTEAVNNRISQIVCHNNIVHTYETKTQKSGSEFLDPFHVDCLIIHNHYIV